MPAGTPASHPPSHLSTQDVRKVARLARLAITDEQAERERGRLAAILTYVERLQTLDLADVEPLSTPLDMTSRLDDDTPGPTISNQVLMDMAPGSHPPFVKVPKVLGEGGGA